MLYPLAIHGTLYPLGLNPGIALFLIKFCLTYLSLAAAPTIALSTVATPDIAMAILATPAIALATVATPELLIEWATSPQTTLEVDQCNHLS